VTLVGDMREKKGMPPRGGSNRTHITQERKRACRKDRQWHTQTNRGAEKSAAARKEESEGREQRASVWVCG